MPSVEYHRKQYNIDVSAYKSNNHVTGMRVGIYPLGSTSEKQIPITTAPEGKREFRDLGQAYINEIGCPGIGKALQAAGLAHPVDRTSMSKTMPLYQFDCKRLYDIEGFTQYRDDWKATFNAREKAREVVGLVQPVSGYFYKGEIDTRHSGGHIGERTPYRTASDMPIGDNAPCNLITVPHSWASPLNRFDASGSYHVLTGRTKVEMPKRAGHENDLPGVFYVNNSQIYEDGHLLHIALGAGARVRFGDNREESWKPAKFISTVVDSRLPDYMKETQRSVTTVFEERARVNQSTINISDEIPVEYGVDMPEQ